MREYGQSLVSVVLLIAAALAISGAVLYLARDGGPEVAAIPDPSAEEATQQVEEATQQVRRRSKFRPPSKLQNRGANAPQREGEMMVLHNRESGLETPFQGEVHPVLTGNTRLEVTARWIPMTEPVRPGPKGFDERVRRLVERIAPEQEKRVYTGADFSTFLPAQIGRVGQVWALSLKKVRAVLEQLHRNPVMLLESEGRVIGQNGAFAILRATSPGWYDVVFRIHAEFRLGKKAWYTPGYLAGRLVINRRAGTVEAFRLELPTDRLLNAHITVSETSQSQSHWIVRAGALELAGGDPKLADTIEWEEEVSEKWALHRLALQYFKFLDIEWVRPEESLALAQATNKPILAVVLKGALDDQSC